MAWDIFMWAITFAAVGLVGGLSFGAGWILSARRPRVGASREEPVDPTLDRDIDDAAHEWAVANGHPELAALLADKVRIAWRIRYGQGKSGGWSR